MHYFSPVVRVLLAAILGAASPALARYYTVTNIAGGNVAGSLYNAVLDSYYSSPDPVDIIQFNIPGAGPHIITLDGPSSNGGAGGTYYVGRSGKSVAINATTQPGYNGQPLVYINANGNGTAFYLVGGTVHTVAGFAVYNYSGDAVTIANTSQGNWIQYNWLGFVPNGAGFLKNTGLNASYVYSRGVGLSSSFNVVRYNVISGVDNAITIGDNPTPANREDRRALYVTNSITGNFIGTTPDGNGIIGSTSDGIFLGLGAAQNFIGPDNVISGQASAGVELLHASNYGNVIFRNRIGTNAAGTAALGNGELGVVIAGGATYNVVGGPWGGNVISGNSLGGVVIGLTYPPPGFYSWASITYVQGNIIGLDITGSRAINTAERQEVGISIEGGSNNVIIQNNFIGGHLNHSIQGFNSSLFNIEGNTLGAGVNGINIPALRGAGIYLQNCNTVYNTTKNFFGINPLGDVLNNGSFNIYP